ncbi:MAG: phytase [Cyclonatronaceae bacterium]
MNFFRYIAIAAVIAACQPDTGRNQSEATADQGLNEPAGSSETVRVQPVFITEPAPYDTDDPAIWIHPEDPSQSLVLGTDKGGDTDQGGLYVYTLDGQIDHERSVVGLDRPNNVDVAYGFTLGSETIDIAVVTVRRENAIRIFSLPDMAPVDNGGIPVFEGEEMRDPMGIGLYTDPQSGRIYAVVGRKDGPADGTYLWQYELSDSGEGYVTGSPVRKLGNYSGLKEIEAIAVDNEAGYIYYSDEMFGVRKYYAHPDSSTGELNLFGRERFVRDHEGISIYKNPDAPGTGYVIVSDQQGQRFQLYRREGNNEFVKTVHVEALESDGNEITHIPLNDRFPRGLFVAMSDDKTFHFYSAAEIVGND